jgi:hypothetical protein
VTVKAIGSKLISNTGSISLPTLDVHLSRVNKRFEHFSDVENDLISIMKELDILGKIKLKSV